MFLHPKNIDLDEMLCPAWLGLTTILYAVETVKPINVFLLWRSESWKIHIFWSFIASHIENTHVFHSRSEFFFSETYRWIRRDQVYCGDPQGNILNRVKGGVYWGYWDISTISSMYVLLPLKSWETVFDDHVHADLFRNFRWDLCS